MKRFVRRTASAMIAGTVLMSMTGCSGSKAKVLEAVGDYCDAVVDMDLSKINFIDKITCTIKRDVQEDDSAKKSSNTPKVLYKPVFYRVVDLQNITIRAGITQNIGVALAEYMTKVESFKMVIGGMEIVESARNDIYAIFPVNGSSIGVDTGTYHITNQDGELISSGQFTVIQ